MPNEVVVSIPLTLVDEGGRWLESSPEGVGIGMVHLNRWQIHPVKLEPGTFDDSSAFLVKVNYQLDLEPDCPALSWFEIGIHCDGDAAATVLDAVPHGALDPRPACSYTINRHTQLVATELSEDALAYLPVIDERVDLYGIGSSSVRWRYSTQARAGTRPGSRAAWMILLTPDGIKKLDCRLTVRYALPVDENTPYLPTQEPASFTISLDDPHRGSTVSPSQTASLRTYPVDNPRSVFICYAHESPKFKSDALRLAQVLLTVGLDVHMDQFDEGPRMHWGVWSRRHFMERDFTLVLASPMLRRVGDGTLDENRHPGLRAEWKVLETLYHRHAEWAPYVLPVILPGQSKLGIPLLLGPECEDYYEVDDFTPEGMSTLLNAIFTTELRSWRFD
ncbi:hypothetical protein [Crossiella sp. NPDC003009]